MRAILVVLMIALAGCSSQGDEDAQPADDQTGTTPQGELPQVFGWILDGAIAPIVGASIEVQTLDANATTNEGGRYALDGLPTDETLVFVARAEGFKTSSKSLMLRPDESYILNFTLSAEPVIKPTSEVQTFTGFLSCSVITKTNSDRRTTCGEPDPAHNNLWQFSVDPQLAGLVVEVVWDQNTDLSRDLWVSVETVDFGDLNEVLAEAEGASLLRAQVNNFQAERFYTQGGTVQVRVDVGADVEGTETGMGAGVAVQQEFEMFATAFYVEQPPAGYTIENT